MLLPTGLILAHAGWLRMILGGPAPNLNGIATTCETSGHLGFGAIPDYVYTSMLTWPHVRSGPRRLLKRPDPARIGLAPGTRAGRCLPCPGEILAAPDAAAVRARIPYEVVGTISDDGLLGPDELVFYAGEDRLSAGRGGLEYRHFHPFRCRATRPTPRCPAPGWSRREHLPSRRLDRSRHRGT